MADQLPRVAHSAAVGYLHRRLVDSSAHYSAVRAGDNRGVHVHSPGGERSR